MWCMFVINERSREMERKNQNLGEIHSRFWRNFEIVFMMHRVNDRWMGFEVDLMRFKENF